MPEIVAITPIAIGYNPDGTMKKIKPGQTLKMSKTGDMAADPPVFSEETIYEYINGGVAFDKTRELNGWLPPGLDEETLLRDQFLLENGYPVHVDTSNSGDQHIPQPNPAAEEHKVVAAQIEAKAAADKGATKPASTASKS